MILTIDLIHSLFKKFKIQAIKDFEKGDYNACLKYLGLACQTAYTFYIGFTDNEIEAMLQGVSEKIQKRSLANSDSNKVVMYDSFSQDSQGLTMQYVDAIVAAGYDLLYITSFNLNDPRSRLLKQTLLDYPKATIWGTPRKKTGLEWIQSVYNKIIDFAPSKLFMHFYPDAVAAAALFYALPKEITKYQINLTDHTYWVGAGCVDYSFEFRDYGASLSVGRRGIPKDRMLLLPYYPMMKATEFKGFPKEVERKVKIFSGASFYKIMDENDTFFILNKAILEANPNAVTLFAGGGDMVMLNSLIEKYGLKGRFIPIGQRNDIFECYKHSDIYLSSYPLGGGLMSQFAAHAGLPILALANSKTSGKIEEMVCQKHWEDMTFDSMDALVAEASRLVNDTSYRQQRGQAMRNCVISMEEFNRSFKASVETNQSQYLLSIDENVELHYLNVEDKLKLVNNSKGYQASILRSLGGWRTLCVSPGFVIDGAMARIKTSRYGKYFK